MFDPTSITDVQDVELLIAFSDLSGFARAVHNKISSLDLFKLMDRYFEFMGDIIESAGGTLVKCIGDSGLIVFPPDKVDNGVIALKELKAKGDQWLSDNGLPCRQNIKVHFGPVSCGPLGPRGDKRFDIGGDNVNLTARLSSNGLALSP